MRFTIISPEYGRLMRIVLHDTQFQDIAITIKKITLKIITIFQIMASIISPSIFDFYFNKIKTCVVS